MIDYHRINGNTTNDIANANTTNEITSDEIPNANTTNANTTNEIANANTTNEIASDEIPNAIANKKIKLYKIIYIKDHVLTIIRIWKPTFLYRKWEKLSIDENTN